MNFDVEHIIKSKIRKSIFINWRSHKENATLKMMGQNSQEISQPHHHLPVNRMPSGCINWNHASPVNYIDICQWSILINTFNLYQHWDLVELNDLWTAVMTFHFGKVRASSSHFAVIFLLINFLLLWLATQ